MAVTAVVERDRNNGGDGGGDDDRNNGGDGDVDGDDPSSPKQGTVGQNKQE